MLRSLRRLAPSLTMIAYVQTFGRAAWHSLLSNVSHLIRLRGFLRCNTLLFVTFMLFAYVLMLIGNMTVVAIASDAGGSSDVTARRIKAAYAIVEGGLILQTLLLLIFALLVWRWKYISGDWDVEWDEVRRARWTWRPLLRVVLGGAGLLLVGTACSCQQSRADYNPLGQTSLHSDSLLLDFARSQMAALRLRHLSYTGSALQHLCTYVS